MIEKAGELKSEKGLLAEPNKKLAKKISEGMGIVYFRLLSA